MPISMPSANRTCLLAGLVAAAAALAKDSGQPAIERQGAGSLERLERAVGQAREADTAGMDPQLPSPPSETERRRAFEGLLRRREDPAIATRARAAASAGEAALARERENQARRLRQALGLESTETPALAKASAKSTPTSWIPVLFVSSSMPTTTLRSYAAQLERVKGVLAFRGMPAGLKKVGPMAKLTAEILRLDPGCEGPACTMRDVQIIIDPIVFRQHDVTRVPALAMMPGDPAQPYCERDDESLRATHLVLGDSALSGLLDEYARLGGAQEVKHAQALLAAR